MSRDLRKRTAIGLACGVLSPGVTAAPPCNDGPVFELPVSVPVLDRPVCSELADFDGDGDLDLAVANFESDLITVHENLGIGVFAEGDIYPGGNGPQFVRSADVDGDGILDLLYTSLNDGTLTLRRGIGGGKFTPAQIRYDIGSGPRGFELGDLNGDGSLDVVVANLNVSTVTVLLNNGIGNFVEASGSPIMVGAGARSISLADFDGDSNLDFVTADRTDDTATVMFGDGTGSFGAPITLSTNTAPDYVDTGDLDGNGEPDIVVANAFGNDVSVFLNTGGAFLSEVRYTTGAGPSSAAIGDYNGDAIPDIATSNFGGSSSILFGVGDGTFLESQEYTTEAASANIAAGDLDGDGDTDLAVANANADSVSIQFNDGQGRFSVEPRYAVGEKPELTELADLDRDGDLDAVCVNIDSNDVSVLLNLGDGTFAPEFRIAVGLFPTSVALADFNGDNDPDIATADSGQNTVSVVLSDGSLGYQPPQMYSVLDTPIDVVSGDLNNDGAPDLAVVNRLVGSERVNILMNDGTGMFSAGPMYPVGAEAIFGHVADLDADGDDDIVVANLRDDTLSIFLNDGMPGVASFTEMPMLVTSETPEGMATGDADGDGLPELFVACLNDDFVNMFPNLGGGLFGPRVILTAGDAPRRVRVGDLNRDGHLDAICANIGSNDVSVFLGDGAGNFSTQSRFDAGSGARSCSLGDLDGDGVLDAVTTNLLDEEISVLINQSRATAFWSAGALSQSFTAGGNWSGGVAPSLGDPNTAVFDESVIGFMGSDTVTLTFDAAVLSLFHSSGQIDFNMNGNNLFIIGDGTFRDGPIGLELGSAQCEGPDPFPVIPPRFTIDNFLIEPQSIVTPHVTVGRDGPATLEINGTNGRAILNAQQSMVIGGRGAGTVQLCTDNSEIFFGELFDPQSRFLIGDAADGTMSVKNSARVSPMGSAPLTLGRGPGVTGVLEIEDPGSRFGHIGSRFVVGDEGRGEIRITNGGRLETQVLDIVLASAPGSSADILISGPGSVWSDIVGEINFGNGDSISLTVENGGALDVAGGVVVASNGVLRGDGTVSEVVNFGDVIVGGRGPDRGLLPATMTITGDYDQFDDPFDPDLSGRVFVDLFDAGATLNADQLIVQGDALLAGGLIFESEAPVDPSGIGELDVLVADTISRRFDVAFFPAVMPGASGEGRFLRVRYNNTLLGSGETVSISVDTLTGEISTDPAEMFDVNGQPMAAAVGDLNNDTLIDLALAVPDPAMPGAEPGSVIVLYNAGTSNGVWNGFAGTAQITVGTDPSGIAIGDADLDGGLDIAVTNRADDTAMVLTNSGTGLPGSISVAQVFAVGDEPSAVAFGDLNEDAWADLAVTNFGSNNVSVFENMQGVGGGWMGVGSPQTLPAGQGPVDVIFGDLDEDKWDDVIVANANDGTVTYFDNAFPPGSFDPPLVLGSDMGSSDLICDDLDGDGIDDLIVSNPMSDTVSIILNNGNSTFEPVVNLPLAGGPRSIAAVDLDDDLDLDLTVIADDAMGANTIRVLRNDLTDGQLIFSPDADIDTGGAPLFVLAGDVDDDGQGDLITVNSTSGVRSEETGVPAMPIGVVRQSAAPCLGDCDGNGIVEFNDLVAMLFLFGDELAPAPCDADESGVVEFNDLVAALFLFGPCP
ncbi:MAG: VCBS repeat-containing protein [Phycisphaerales bacterium]